MERSEGFPPIAKSNARWLILGSLPGQRSLAASRYYAHPQNAFWRIMQDLYGIEGSYTERCLALQECRLALWDVLKASERPGSLDADIKRSTAAANDFGNFFCQHKNIELIAFNGKKAEELFRALVPDRDYENIPLIGLPSTSPAYAAMPYARKLEHWSRALIAASDA